MLPGVTTRWGQSTPTLSALFKTPRATAWLSRVTDPSTLGQLAVQADERFVLAHLDWLNGWLNRTQVPQQAEVVTFDYLGKVTHRYAYARVAIASVTFPTVDVASTAPARLTAKLESSGAKESVASAQERTFTPKYQSRWLCNAFRIEGGSLNWSRATRIEGFTITTTSLPALKVRLLASDVTPFREWFEKLVVNGRYSGASAVAMQVAYLSTSLTKLFALDLKGVFPFDLKESVGTGTFDISLAFQQVALSPG